MITANARTTANRNARLSGSRAMSSPSWRWIDAPDVRGTNHERCVNYFTLARNAPAATNINSGAAVVALMRPKRDRWGRLQRQCWRAFIANAAVELIALAPAFAALKGRADALFISADPLVFSNRIHINILAAAARL